MRIPDSPFAAAVFSFADAPQEPPRTRPRLESLCSLRHGQLLFLLPLILPSPFRSQSPLLLLLLLLLLIDHYSPSRFLPLWCLLFQGRGTPIMVQLRRSRSMTRTWGAKDDADERGWNPLHVAARKGDLKEVRRLLDEGMDVNAPSWGPKSPGSTALHLAALGGHVKIMDELLERGANIDARTKGACGWTPLHIAAQERNKRAVRFLVENGAFLPPEMNDHRFNPPLHYCSGLEWAYEMKRAHDKSDSTGETSLSLEN